MYQKYSTECIILSSRERGETDRAYALYTRDFGFLWARAGAVRTAHSKMRMALQNYSSAHISLIKGKSGWRIAGARSHITAVGKMEKQVASFARIARLVLRLVHGEDNNSYLYDSLCEAHQALMSESVDRGLVELVCVARILFSLGYISDEALTTTLFTHTAYGVEQLGEALGDKEKILSSINKALQETHL